MRGGGHGAFNQKYFLHPQHKIISNVLKSDQVWRFQHKDGKFVHFLLTLQKISCHPFAPQNFDAGSATVTTNFTAKHGDNSIHHCSLLSGLSVIVNSKLHFFQTPRLFWHIQSSGGIKGGMGENAPQSEALPPLAPSQKKKMAKISHFLQIFGFLPPQNRILPPRCPHKKFLVPPLILRELDCKSLSLQLFARKQHNIWKERQFFVVGN